MSRLPRLPSMAFGWYYVALATENGRSLVNDAADLELFMDLLVATLRKKGAHLHAGYVTGAEAHLAIQNGEGCVSAITRSFCRVYARRSNQIRGESGGLFRPHPHVLLIQHSMWLVPLVHVIHWMPRLRPPPAGSAQYSWNSDSVYRRRSRREGLVTHVVLHLLSKGTRYLGAQGDVYRMRFDHAPDAGLMKRFSQGASEDPRVLGDAEFVAEVWRATRQRLPRRKRLAESGVDVQPALIDVVQQFGGICRNALPRKQADLWTRIVTPEQLRSHSRKRPLPMLRAVIASYVIEHHMATRAQMARFFGCRPETLAAQRRRHHEARFGEVFGATPEIIFNRGRGDRSVRLREEEDKKPLGHIDLAESGEFRGVGWRD